MSEPIKVDAETALRVLDECVAERGEDYCYQRFIGNACLYWHGNPENGQPGCLIGLALHKLGVPAEELYKHDTNTITTVARMFKRNGIADISHDASGIFRVAQSAQDHGETWGTAVYQARDRYNINRN